MHAYNAAASGKHVRVMYTPLEPPLLYSKKVQVGKDQEKAQSEKDSHSKNQGGNKQVLIP